MEKSRERVAELLKEAQMMDTVRNFAIRFGTNGKLPSVAVELSDGRGAYVGTRPTFPEFEQEQESTGNQTMRINFLVGSSAVRAAYRCMLKGALFQFEGRYFWVKEMKPVGTGDSARIRVQLEAMV